MADKLAAALHGLGIVEAPKPGELKHYGVPGMKWGVRRNRNVTKGKVEPKTPAKPGEKFPSRKPDAAKMSDKELKAVINRMQMEKTYKELSTPKVTGAKKFIQDQLLQVAKQQTGIYANKVASAGIEAGIGALTKEIAKLAPYVVKL